jgi:predicted anti-sigma-YlaC factor YlaD
MECETYREQMSLWIDHQLAPQEIQELESHAATCPSCRASLDAFRRLDRLLASAPMMSPATGFTARFQYRLTTRRRRRRTWAGLFTLLIATMILSLGAVTILAVSGLAVWETASATGLLSDGISLLLDLGKVAVAALKLAWLILSALTQGIRHPVFIAYALATAILMAAWARVVTQRVLAARPVPIDL